MKTSKFLLVMLVAGSVLTATVSCSKDDKKDIVAPKVQEVTSLEKFLTDVTAEATKLTDAAKGYDTSVRAAIKALNDVKESEPTTTQVAELTKLAETITTTKTKVDEQITDLDANIQKTERHTQATLKAKKTELEALSKKLGGFLKQIKAVKDAKALLAEAMLKVPVENATIAGFEAVQKHIIKNTFDAKAADAYKEAKKALEAASPKMAHFTTIVKTKLDKVNFYIKALSASEEGKEVATLVKNLGEKKVFLEGLYNEAKDFASAAALSIEVGDLAKQYADLRTKSIVQLNIFEGAEDAKKEDAKKALKGEIHGEATTLKGKIDAKAATLKGANQANEKKFLEDLSVRLNNAIRYFASLK